MPSTLYPLDTTTGETQYCALRHTEGRVPETLRFESMFDTRLRTELCDRYGANLRVAKSCQSQDPQLKSLVFTCDIHKTHSAIKHTLKVVDPTVSGVVHTALATSGSGSLGKLQEVLQQVFDKELVIIMDTPPVHCRAYHDAVLNLFCPVHDNSSRSFQNAKRQFLLRRMCNSDLTSGKIVHYCTYNCCASPEQTREIFFREVVWSFLPKKAPILQRKSWTKSDDSFEWMGLLHSHWNLLGKIMEVYTGSPQTTPCHDEEQPQQDDDFANNGEHVSLVTFDEDDEDTMDTSSNIIRDFLDGKISWADVNKQYKKKAAAFTGVFTVSFREVLAVTIKVLRPAMSLLASQLEMAGVEWERRQQYQEYLQQRRTYPVLETATDRLLTPCFVEVFQILLGEPAGIPFECFVRRARSIQFRLCSSLMSALHFTMRRYHKSFPWQLFILLEDTSKADAIYRLPRCLHDTLAQTFFAKYSSPQQGVSREALAFLELIASATDVDISSVEASHSSTREYAMARSRGHTPTLAQVSAQTVFRFVRKHYDNEHADGNGGDGDDGDTQPKQKPRRKNQNIGAWNAFLSQRLNGRPISKELIGELRRDYAALSHDEFQEFRELGLAKSLKTETQNHAAIVPLWGTGMSMTDLVASPVLTMTEFDQFIDWQKQQRKDKTKAAKQFEENMKKAFRDVERDKDFVASVLSSSCGGEALVTSMQPKPQSSTSVAKHYTWKPFASSFAQVRLGSKWFRCHNTPHVEALATLASSVGIIPDIGN